jgi:hypothetical protein
MQNFSMSKVLSIFESKGPTLLRLLITAAMAKDKRYEPKPVKISKFVAGARVPDIAKNEVNIRSQSRLSK